MQRWPWAPLWKHVDAEDVVGSLAEAIAASVAPELAGIFGMQSLAVGILVHAHRFVESRVDAGIASGTFVETRVSTECQWQLRWETQWMECLIGSI